MSTHATKSIITDTMIATMIATYNGAILAPFFRQS
jgi:ribosomal protein S19